MAREDDYRRYVHLNLPHSRTIIARIPVPVVPLRGHSDIRVSA